MKLKTFLASLETAQLMRLEESFAQRDLDNLDDAQDARGQVFGELMRRGDDVLFDEKTGQFNWW